MDSSKADNTVSWKTLKNRKKRLKKKLKAAKAAGEIANSSKIFGPQQKSLPSAPSTDSSGTRKKKRKICTEDNGGDIFDYYGKCAEENKEFNQFSKNQSKTDSPTSVLKNCSDLPTNEDTASSDCAVHEPKIKKPKASEKMHFKTPGSLKTGKKSKNLKGGDRINDSDADDLSLERRDLPVFDVKEELMKFLSEHKCAIVKGDTGSGKTTQIPQYILDCDLAPVGMIAITQPRRVAAISIAERVSQERKCDLGGEVGYSVRFEDVTSADTKIKYVTDGMLLRESISDPLLLDYSWIILDEAHERTIHTDILFGIVKLAQSIREDENMMPLKVIVMSATVEESKMSEYFDDAPVYSIQGRPYRIKVFNANEAQEDYLESVLRTVIMIHQNEEEGDILAFLTGEEEITYAYSEISKYVSGLPEGSSSALELEPHALYAALPSSQQLRALKKPPPGIRKVIFSTNIAETSVTIPNIRFVVDSGMVKCRTYNAVGGLDVLKVEKVSKAQAEQRTGRAGRQFHGNCYRLYTVEQYQNFRDYPIPEIQRCSLAGVVLEIVAIGITRVMDFDFMDRPSDENIQTAIEQLKLLGAVQEKGDELSLTKIGNTMSKFPLDPRFSKIIISSQKYKCTDEVLSIISLLSVDAVFLSVSNERDLHKYVRHKFNHNKGDLITLLNVYKALKAAKFSVEWCLAHRINLRNVKRAVAIRRQLSTICQRVGIPPCSCGQDTELIRKCFLTGLFMNTAMLVTKKEYRGLSNNQKVYVHPSSTLFHQRPEFVMYTDLMETSKCYMRNLSSIEKEWLEEVAADYFRSRRLTQLQSSS